MYTGIVQACVPIKYVDKQDGLYQFSVELPESLLTGLELGASVAVNGVCFTVTKIDDALVHFDAIRETLELSNIKQIALGTSVNIERSAMADAEVGGHILSGHIVGTAPVIAVESTTNNRRVTFKAEAGWLKFVFEKGFLAINGASLTVAAVDRENSQFSVNLIPETLERTNFAFLKVDDTVNIEVESQTQVIVETVERVMAERFASV